MAEMPNIDPNFEPQSRPRSGTWPLNRPNIQPRKNRMQDMGGTFLDTTLEEANSQELIASESNMQLEPFMKDDYLSLLPPDSMSDIDCILMGSSPTANLVTDLSAISNTAIKPEPVCNPGTILSEYCSPSTMTELSNLPEGKTLEDVQSLQQQHQQTAMQIQNTANASVNFVSSSPSLSKSSPSTTVTTTPPAASTGATPKAKSTRKNAWGNMSYADLITQAIESSPEKRLTLAQIYEWMVKNVPYFKDKGDSNSSAGWKNSIRHNLSLHAKFKRIQNEGTGKSSWWVINHEAKPGKSPRRRAISMDNASTKYSRSRNKALAKQKAAEIMKKHKAGMKPGQRESGSWSRDPTTGLETPVSKALGSDYRQRASSNASSLGGRTSPSLFFAQDLDDDGAPPLSPLSGSISNLTSLPTSGGVGSIFDMVRQDPSTIPESLSTDRMVQDNLLESLASMDMTPDTKAGIYMQQMNGSQQNAKNNAIVQSTPELASLLSSPSPNKNLQKNTKQEQQWNDKGPYPYPDYQNQQQMIPQVQMQSPPQYKSPLQRGVNEDKPLYHFVPRIQRQNDLSYGQPNQVQQQQANYIQQQQRMQPYMTGQQMVQSDNQQPQPPPQYDSANIIQMGQANFPSDLANLENQQVFDSGDLDMNAVLSDIPSPDYASAYFGMEFESEGVNGGKPASFFSQMQDANDYNMGMNGNNMMDSSNTSGTSMQQQQPTMHPNPDVFITNTGPGSTSVDLMMRDGCRMNNANFQRMQATQQPPSVGASSYSMQ